MRPGGPWAPAPWARSSPPTPIDPTRPEHDGPAPRPSGRGAGRDPSCPRHSLGSDAMRGFRGPVVGLLTSATVWVVLGCGGKPSVDSSNTEATVKGVVTINGAPATGGEISFDPTNYQRKFAPLAVAPL